MLFATISLYAVNQERKAYSAKLDETIDCSPWELTRAEARKQVSRAYFSNGYWRGFTSRIDERFTALKRARTATGVGRELVLTRGKLVADYMANLNLSQSTDRRSYYGSGRDSGYRDAGNVGLDASQMHGAGARTAIAA